MFTVLLAGVAPGTGRRFRSHLEAAGLRVYSATGAEHARELARELCIDLLVSPLFLPGISGPDLAQDLEAFCPGLQVLYLNSGRGSVMADALSESLDCVLSDPTSGELRHHVEALLFRRMRPAYQIHHDPPPMVFRMHRAHRERLLAQAG